MRVSRSGIIGGNPINFSSPLSFPSQSCRLETLRVGCIVVGVVFFGVLLMVIVIYMRKNEQRKKKLARFFSFLYSLPLSF